MIAALSLIAVFFFTYLGLMAAWMAFHFREVSSFREKRDTFAASVVSFAYVGLHVLAFVRSSECSSNAIAAGSILVALGLGWYVERSLERRLSWHQFCAQEEAKRAHVSEAH